MANRTERIKSVIGKSITDIIQFEVKNPKIGFATVTEVDVSPDFSYAKVYVSFLGTKYPKQNLAELEKSKGFIRSKLAHKIDLRRTPEISFALDDSFDRAKKIDELLKKDGEEISNLKK